MATQRTTQTATTEESVDGRSARRERNKVVVVDAYLDLIRDGVPRPSMAEVADRSGFSVRSVFRYFADRDEMARTSIQRQQERVGALYDQRVDESLSLADRISGLVELRISLYETIAPTARLSRSLAPTQPIIEAELASTRGHLRAAVKRLFASELAGMATDDAADALAVIDVLTSFESFDLLRSDRGLSKPRVARALRAAITTLLA